MRPKFLATIGMSAFMLAGPAIEVGATDTHDARSGVLAALMRLSVEYQRPFGETAPWNTPVWDLPDHDDSDYYSDLLWDKSPSRPGNFNLSFDTYTYPVYYASDATGEILVQADWGGNVDGKTIPWHPDWKPAPGKDAQIIILDPPSGREWDLFQVIRKKSYLKVTNGNLVPGDYRSMTRGYPPSRGIGIPYLAMLVRPEEVAAGRIEHALSMPISNPSGTFFVAPATKLENDTGREGIPIGMRFALSVTEEEIQTWLAEQTDFSPRTRASALAIARALRDYGWFITDTSGGASFQFEANVSARREWAALGLSERGGSGRVLPRDLLDGLITRDRIYAIAPSDEY